MVENATEYGTVTGAIGGALAGCIIGHIANKGCGKGAAVGAVGGGVIGHHEANKSARTSLEHKRCSSPATKHEPHRTSSPILQQLFDVG